MTLEEELLATEEEDVTELEEATELLLFAEELLDSSLDELRMTLLELRATLEEESSFSLELLATDDEDFAELDDATELLLFSLELLATDDEDFAELELATELLDSSLDELRMTLLELGATLEEESSFSLEEDGDPGSEPGTLEEELLATEEEDVTELEEATELLLFAEELLDPSLSLRMTLEEELATSPTAPQTPSTHFSSRFSS